MLSSLVIEGYRCFDRFEIPELRRVNLLVGRNNAGKSSVLEAVGVLVSGGDPETMDLVFREREVSELLEEDNFRPRIPIMSLFRGHDPREGDFLRVSGALDGREAFIELSLGKRRGVDEPESAPASLVARAGKRAKAPQSLTLRRQGWEPAEATATVRQGLLHSGTFGDAFWEWSDAEEFAIRHIGVGREPAPVLAAMWDKIVGNPEEAGVVEALRVLEPTLERVVFTHGDPNPRAFAVLQGTTGRVPFTSLGEGSWRILGIAMDLALAKTGHSLLIDEVDTGLHHTTLVKVWKLLLSTAKARDVQIFATSHSQDCLRALAELHASEPDLTEDFMLHYINRDEPRARSFTAAEVETAIAHDLELRG